MVPLKPLALCSLLFILAECLQMRNDAHGVRPQEESVVETDDDDGDCSTDEEQNTIQKRMTNSKISDGDLKSISSKIWNSVADLDVQYDNTPDSHKLFHHRDETNRTIDEPFRNLFQYYEKQTGIEDPCVMSMHSQCKADQDRFLSHIFEQTGPIKILHDNLTRHGIYTEGYDTFKTYLKTMWFTPYSRSRGRPTLLDSSAFEHVFLGEIKKNGGVVAGMHNWMRMYVEEDAGHFKLDTDLRSSASRQPFVADVKFTWNGKEKKPSSTFFMKKNPAVEIALYTLCFMARPNKPGNPPCLIDLGPWQIHVIAIPKNENIICTAYPKIPPNPKTY